MADPFYQPFTTTRATEPHFESLLAQLRGLDATAGIQHQVGTSAWTLKKNTAWTAPQIATAQNVLDTAPVSTPQLIAQAAIDRWPIEFLALVDALIDEINVLRAEINVLRSKVTPPLTPDLPPRTRAGAVAAIRAKAGQP